jgi:excinuclease ABC subunit A
MCCRSCRIACAGRRRSRRASSEAIEAALRLGEGRLDVYPEPDGRGGAPWRFSTGLHCPDCDIAYKDPSPSTFSFNSPIGACETCRGFGRNIGVDYGLVIPDGGLVAAGARSSRGRPSPTRNARRTSAFARKRGIPLDTPWNRAQRRRARLGLDGEGEWKKNVWYGVRRFFAWLETKAYKMHIRVLLSRYRSYTECAACRGARLKPDSAAVARSAARGRTASRGPGSLNIRDVMLMPLDACRASSTSSPCRRRSMRPPILLREIRTRLRYLTDVGLGYLCLDRQSRTLSGGEVQRINLTTALGTSLVNTLFVLDEPSIGLHARDVDRIVGVMQRLRDAGNTLVVVEHDPKVMQAADRLIDIGPGPESTAARSSSTARRANWRWRGAR